MWKARHGHLGSEVQMGFGRVVVEESMFLSGEGSVGVAGWTPDGTFIWSVETSRDDGGVRGGFGELSVDLDPCTVDDLQNFRGKGIPFDFGSTVVSGKRRDGTRGGGEWGSDMRSRDQRTRGSLCTGV